MRIVNVTIDEQSQKEIRQQNIEKLNAIRAEKAAAKAVQAEKENQKKGGKAKRT